MKTTQEDQIPPTKEVVQERPDNVSARNPEGRVDDFAIPNTKPVEITVLAAKAADYATSAHETVVGLGVAVSVSEEATQPVGPEAAPVITDAERVQIATAVSHGLPQLRIIRIIFTNAVNREE